MTKALIILCTIMATLCMSAHARTVEEGRSTIERMNSLLQTSLREIVRQVQADSISVHVATHPDADFIRVMAINAMGARVVVARPLANSELFITPVDVSTRYETTDATDSLDRVISVSLTAILTENGKAKALQTQPLKERQRLHRNDALRLQSMQRASTNAQIPPMPTTFWDDVLQPAIFVAAAVTTVVLLFTVRSQ